LAAIDTPEQEGCTSEFVMAGHSQPKDGVVSLAYDPAIHDFAHSGK
jgi:hypothetical protein